MQGAKTIKSTGVTIFNKLPTHIINCTSLNGFNVELRNTSVVYTNTD